MIATFPALNDSTDRQSRSLQREAVTLPAEMYTDPEIYRREQTQIFGKYWFNVGHTSQFDGAGSYFTVEIAEQPLVILIDRHNQLKAYFNICTHRAGPVAVGSGDRKSTRLNSSHVSQSRMPSSA